MSWSAGTFTRTNGVYSGTGVWASDEAANVDIESARHDTHDQDLATGINSCIHKGGQNAATADLPMGGFKHSNVGDATALTNYGKVSQIQNGSYMWGSTATGSSGNYAITCSPTPGAYAAGQTFRFIANHINTGSSTLNVNSLGTKSIKAFGTLDLACWRGAIRTNNVIEVVYDGTQFCLLNPQNSTNTYTCAGTTQGTATAIDTPTVILTTGTAGASDGVILPASVIPGFTVDVHNRIAGTMKVYPNSGDQIDALGANVASTIANAIWYRFVVHSTGPVQWYRLGS